MLWLLKSVNQNFKVEASREYNSHSVINSIAGSPEGGKRRKQAVIDYNLRRLQKSITKNEHATYFELYQTGWQFFVN